MPDYSKGKIYKIECFTTGLIYVGSTTEIYLCRRLVKHISQYKKFLNDGKIYITSFKILENNNYHIELLEEVNCETKDQLHSKEAYYIRTLNCVNKYIPNRTHKESQQQYYQTNKEKLLEKNKRYKENNKEELKKKGAVIFNCPCGVDIQHRNITQHNKTNNHQTYLETLNN